MSAVVKARRAAAARRVASKPRSKPERFDPDQPAEVPPLSTGYRPPRALLGLVRRDTAIAREALARIDAALTLLDA